MIDEFFGEMVDQEFSGPWFVTIIIHTSGSSIGCHICFTTCSACFEITIKTFDFVACRFVEVFCAY